jgi:tRNA (mo5U34)-methyltransferase
MEQLRSEDGLRRSIESLAPWFHNIHLPDGTQTAPQHFLGDFPMRKWAQIAPHIPADLCGWSVLDIGCNAGFYSIELAKRGADVLGIDSDEHYLRQARWVAEQFKTRSRPRFERMQIHDLAWIGRRFDLVLFMGVFYHLRYPALALDTVSSLVNRLMIFQTLTSDSEEIYGHEPSLKPDGDYPITARDIFHAPGWPRMAFVENKYSGDPTNWWVPNHSCIEAMLRSTGFESVERIAHEIYFCRPPAEGLAARRGWDQTEWASATGRLK